MSVDNYYIQEFEDYIEELCKENIDVSHLVNGQVCFSRLRCNDEVNEIINNAGKNIVILGRFSGRATGSVDEQAVRQFAVLRFACYAENNSGDITGGIDNAIDKAQDIMFQFIARFRYDLKNNDCGPLRGIELESISWNEIDEPIYLQNHYGWDLSIPFRSYLPGYNSADWQSGSSS